MAERKCFFSKTEGSFWEEKLIAFDYYPGFALSQAQKSIRSLHENILKTDDQLRVLEISTKSTEVLGTKLSAFHHKKSINCQARSAAIFVSLTLRGEIDNVIKDPVLFEAIY